jgi:hypothetical protein
MAKTVLKNTARGARGVRGKDGELVMVEPGATVTIDDIDAQELKDALAGDFEKGSAKDAPEEQESQALGEPGPGDPPKPEDPPENEVDTARTGNRRTRG